MCVRTLIKQLGKILCLIHGFRVDGLRTPPAEGSAVEIEIEVCTCLWCVRGLMFACTCLFSCRYMLLMYIWTFVFMLAGL